MGKSVILTLTNVGSKPTAGRAVQLCWGGGTNTDPALAFEVFSHFFFSVPHTVHWTGNYEELNIWLLYSTLFYENEKKNQS